MRFDNGIQCEIKPSEQFVRRFRISINYLFIAFCVARRIHVSLIIRAFDCGNLGLAPLLGHLLVHVLLGGEERLYFAERPPLRLLWMEDEDDWIDGAKFALCFLMNLL